MKSILLFFFLLFVMFAFQIVHYMEFADQMSKFASKGPRFTAQDGQMLCERVARLEKEPQPCTYLTK